jgi:hypothetical protein
MSVNSVSGSTLKRDLVSVLQQARAAATQKVDTTSFTAVSQDTSTSPAASAGSSNTSGSSSTASTPALSNDLMASLLQLQSDFSQAGLQNGLAVPGDGTNSSDPSSTTGAAGTDSSQAANGTGPVHHHRGHHARPPESGSTDETQSGQSGSTGTDATAASGTSATAETGSSTDTGDGLQSFLQQITKAITAYATGGPAGIAAAALTTTAKA